LPALILNTSSVPNAGTKQRPKKVKARVVDVKPEAKIEPKFTMTISEFQAKQAELDGLRAHIKKLQDECASDGIS